MFKWVELGCRLEADENRERFMRLKLVYALGYPCSRMVLALMVLLSGPAHAQGSSASGPFEGFAGAWSGSGTIALSNGRTERLRCEAAYALASAGSSLRQNLSCRSDSYVFELRTEVDYEGGRIAGRWSETSRNLVGRISGRAQNRRIDAVAEGSGFSAEIAMSTSGRRQSVAIRSQGTELSRIVVELTRTQ
jgi:hypothetical protein